MTQDSKTKPERRPVKGMADALQLHPRTQHALSIKDFEEVYTPEELDKLLTEHTNVEAYTLASDRFEESYEQMKRIGQRVWYPEEDEFIKTNYLYLTDAVIALALNVPTYAVRTRRVALGCEKIRPTKLDVIIWADRQNFEEDCKKYNLIKLREHQII